MVIDILKIIGIGLITLICYIIIKPIKQDMAIFISIIGSCIILVMCIDGAKNIFAVIQELINKTGIKNELFVTIIKIIGIGYLIEFASNLCSESGLTSVGDKITLAGKICILTLSWPIVTNLINIVIECLP